MPKSFKFKSLHVGILKDQKEARLKIKHDGTFRHNFRALGEARHNFPCRAYIEPIFAVERRGQPHQAVQDPTKGSEIKDKDKPKISKQTCSGQCVCVIAHANGGSRGPLPVCVV